MGEGGEGEKERSRELSQGVSVELQQEIGQCEGYMRTTV